MSGIFSPFGLGISAQELFERWRKYRTILPADAPPIQAIETRRAYYAGAQAIIDVLISMEGQRSTAQQRVQAIESLRQEVERFRADVAADRA
jgi:hypothetical protein